MLTCMFVNIKDPRVHIGEDHYLVQKCILPLLNEGTGKLT